MRNLLLSRNHFPQQEHFTLARRGLAVPNLASVRVLTGGQTLSVDFSSGGTAFTAVYSDSAGTSSVSLPAEISADTTFYLPAPQDFEVSVKLNDVEIADNDGTTRSVRLRPGQSLVFSPQVDLVEQQSVFLTQASASATYAAVAGAQTLTGAKTFTSMPEVHAAGGEGVINGRVVGDGKLIGAWNVQLDGTDGDLFHFTTGPNTNTSRSVTDAVTTAGSAVITSATAAFTTGPGGLTGAGTDIGQIVTGPGIPAGAKIASVQSATQATLTANATATATGVSLTIGAGNANGGVIAIGIDNGAAGIILVNKHKGVGLNIRQRSSVQGTSAFAMQVLQDSAICDAVAFRLNGGSATKPVVRFDTYNGDPAAGTSLVEWRANTVAGSTLAGKVLADTGVLEWQRNLQVKANASGSTPLLRVLDEVATTPTEAYLSAKTTGESGLVVKRNSTGSGGANRFTMKWVIDAATGDRFILRVSRGAFADGAETWADLITARAIAGTGNLGQMGFFGAAPTNRPAAISSPTADVASLKTAVDAIRSALTTLGLTA